MHREVAATEARFKSCGSSGFVQCRYHMARDKEMNTKLLMRL